MTAVRGRHEANFVQTGVVPIASSVYGVGAATAEQALAFQAGYPGSAVTFLNSSLPLSFQAGGNNSMLGATVTKLKTYHCSSFILCPYFR
jgi:hypothetical protein